MQINPYLFFNSNCEAAFKFYEKVLGAKIEMMLRNEDAPADMPSPPERKKNIMHGRLSIDGHVIMASDAPPDRGERQWIGQVEWLARARGAAVLRHAWRPCWERSS